MKAVRNLMHKLHPGDSESAAMTTAASAAPAHIRGIGLAGAPTMDLRFLKSLGCNAIRTWGVDQLNDHIIADCVALGIDIYAGIWIQSAEPGEMDTVIQQFKHLSSIPSVKCVIIGNEVEHRTDSTRAFRFINTAAQRCKAISDRCTLATVIADPGDTLGAVFMRECPCIDVLGINVYGGMPTLAQRLRNQHVTKPWFLGEFGTLGPWERPKTPWGAAVEPDGAERAHHCGCLPASKEAGYMGAFAFLGGYKVECTPTWFSMVLPGSPPAVLVDKVASMCGSWGSDAPRLPVVKPLLEPLASKLQTTLGPAGSPYWLQGAAGAPFRLTVKAQGLKESVSFWLEPEGSCAGIPKDVAAGGKVGGSTYEGTLPHGPHRLYWLAEVDDPAVVAWASPQGRPVFCGNIPVCGS